MMRSDFQSVVSTVAGSLEPGAPGREEAPRDTTTSTGSPAGTADSATNGDTPETLHRPEPAASTDAVPPTDVTAPEGSEPS